MPSIRNPARRVGADAMRARFAAVFLAFFFNDREEQIHT